jgi:hypothetical protein
MTTTDTSHRGTYPIPVDLLTEGTRIRVNIGGQTLDMNADVIEFDQDCNMVVRSQTETDHVWTKMWVRLGGTVQVVANAAPDDEFDL